MNLIDTHFHLDKYRNHSEIYKTLNDTCQYTLCVTCTPGVFLSCRKLYPETKYVKFALGVHPLDITDPARSIYEFDACIDKASYIGEIGLDYSHRSVDRIAQCQVLRHILSRQAQLNYLATIHVKRAEDDLIQILNEYPSSKRIIHWFNGSKEQMQSLLSTDCYFSVNASMASTEAGIKRIRMIPKNRLLIESDGPYSKVMGKTYFPDQLQNLYQVVQSVLQISDLDKLVYRNFSDVLSK